MELGHQIDTGLSLPSGTNVTGFLTRCTFRVINIIVDEKSCLLFRSLQYIYCILSQGGGLLWLKQMEELHYPGLWKLFYVQLQRKHWRGKIFKAFFLESSFSSKVAKVTVTGSGNGLVLEMFLDQVLFKRYTTLAHHNKPFVFLFDWIHIFQSNYMHNKLSRKAGARITIHDP